MTPAAMAEPITLATFGPMACMSRKFDYPLPIRFCWKREAAIGTADTPAEPMSGLILFC